ncbi:MAG: hypothetical protein AMK72_04720 [Planctomycetes bacterium SM23_25]|nr:MAG: hypothetical protein AMK72_04720 [Planctomycetes bacterium SM23_25]
MGYDVLSVLPPDMAFPKMEGQSADTWKMASLSLPFCLHCRYGPDSKNWYHDETKQYGHPGHFRRTDDPEMGFAYGNMDGYGYLNDDLHLKSVHMGSFRKPTIIQNLRLGGSEGDPIPAAFDSIPKNLKVVLSKGKESGRSGSTT